MMIGNNRLFLHPFSIHFLFYKNLLQPSVAEVKVNPMVFLVDNSSTNTLIFHRSTGRMVGRETDAVAWRIVFRVPYQSADADWAKPNNERREKMKKLTTMLLIPIICAFLSMATIGCEKEGPVEKAGKKVDDAVDSAKEAVDK